jgi:FkbM family methyltransferase
LKGADPVVARPRWLGRTVRALRALPLPARVRDAVWRAVVRRAPGRAYLLPVRWRETTGVYGGVCGVSGTDPFADLTTYESECVPVAETLIRDRARPIVLDIGAHQGAWLFLFKAIRPDAVIRAFEPFPALSRFLVLLRDANQWTDVRVESVLVGADEGEGELHFAPGATDCASTVADFQPTFSASVRLPRITIDGYVEREALAPIALIKIDVEGGELDVLRGARRTLERQRPPLLLELLFTTNPAHLGRQRAAIALLHELGYTFFHIQLDGRLVREDEVRPDPAYRALNYLVTTTRSESSPTLTA